MRWSWLGMLLVWGCGGGAQQEQAQETVRLTARALVDVETSGGEVPDLTVALQDAHDWLGPIEGAIDIWADGGDAAYERVAPCLALALGNVRDALVDAEREVPPSLEQAAAQAMGASEEGCHR